MACATEAAPLKTMTYQQTEENVAQNFRLGNENETQEILRLQDEARGRKYNGRQGSRLHYTVIELKCIVYLISLTALICWFKPRKHLGKPGALPSEAC